MNKSQTHPLSDKQMAALKHFLIKSTTGIERKLRQMMILLLDRSENLTQEVVISLVEDTTISAQLIKKLKDDFDSLVSGSFDLDLIFLMMGTDVRFHMRSQESHGKATLVMSCAPRPTSTATATAPILNNSLQEIVEVNIERIPVDFEKIRMT